LYAQGTLSPENLIQATIYTIIVNGRFLRYRDEFEDALVQLSVARSLLDELAGAATTSRDQALAVLFSDEIGPEIRHCAHELGHAKAYDIDGIVAQLGPNQKNAIVENYDTLVKQLKSSVSLLQGGAKDGESRKKKLKERVWEGQPMPVRNPELVDVLLKVQDGEARLGEAQEQAAASGSKHAAARSKKGIAAYDATLLALSDAEELARKLAEAQQVGSLLYFTSIAIDIKTFSSRVRLGLRRQVDEISTSSTLISSISSSVIASSVTCCSSLRCWALSLRAANLRPSRWLGSQKPLTVGFTLLSSSCWTPSCRV
jgi:signal recognition particle subunit SRP68